MESCGDWGILTDSFGPFGRILKHEMGASWRGFVFHTVRRLRLPHFKSASRNRPRWMVGRREIRGYLLDWSELLCRADRARTLSRSNCPARPATRGSYRRARSNWFSSLATRARGDTSEPMHGLVALRDAAHFARWVSGRKCSPCSPPARIHPPHCKRTKRYPPQLAKRALNVS